jgi:hypothetical protein
LANIYDVTKNNSQGGLSMPFELVLTEKESANSEATKGVGSRFFTDLPQEYKVFLLYYRAAMPDKDLEDKLAELGKNTGKNLFVNLGRTKDSNFAMISKRFFAPSQSFPVIIMTAVHDLASPQNEFVTAFVRLDSKQLLGSPEKTVQCAEKLFNLFIQGDVAKAISSAKWTERVALAGAVFSVLGNALKAVGGFIASRDISVSVVEGKFELKRSGG